MHIFVIITLNGVYRAELEIIRESKKCFTVAYELVVNPVLVDFKFKKMR